MKLSNKSPASARRVMGASALWSLVALGFLGFVVAMLPPDVTAPFWILVRSYDVSAAWTGVAVLVLARALMPLFARINWARFAAFIERNLLVLCALSFGLYAALSFWVYRHVPLAMDEYCPLTQSRSFVAGRSNGWVPPALLDWIMAAGHRGEFFAISQSTGHFTPVYWPGLAILQMPFTALGVSWLCNPFLGALALWGVHRLTLRISASSEAAAWAWLLMLASPVIAINAASFYAMPAHLLFNVFYCLLLLRDDRRGAFGAGLVGGFALILHNPAPHLAFALPWLAFVAWKRRRLLLPLLAGYLVFALPLGFGWSAFLDDFDASRYAQAARATSHGGPPFVEMLSRLEAVVSLPSLDLVLARLTGLAKTVVWAVPGLLVIAWLGWRGAKLDSNQQQSRATRLLAASLLTTFALYWVVKLDQGHGWGFRYLHSAWFVLAVAGGCYLSHAPQNARAFFGALCALSFLILLPQRAWQVEGYIRHHRAQVPIATAPVSITFINGAHGIFTVDLLQNDPFLRNNDWRLKSHGASLNAQLAREYLVNPKREQSGEWGEIWSGSALRHPKQK